MHAAKNFPDKEGIRVDRENYMTCPNAIVYPISQPLAYTDAVADNLHRTRLRFDITQLNDIHQYDTDKDGRIDLTELEVVLLRDGYTEPNTPYVIRPRKTGTFTITQNGGTLYASEQVEKTVSNWNTDFTIHGTYNAIPSEQLPTGVFSGIGNNTLSINEGEGQIDAFRWYVTVSGRNKPLSKAQSEAQVIKADAPGLITL